MLGGGARRTDHEEGELQLDDGQGLGGGGGGGPGVRDDELFDPDSLTYIDEKLQNLLGHCQKDYEGGACAVNLGFFDHHGSFLRTHQRSPSVIPQSRSPAVPPNHGSASRSPYVPLQSAQKSHSVKTELDSRRKDDYCRRTSSGINGNPHQQILNRAANGPEKKAPKIRIKVNSSRSLARNTAAIYSGLGLDISPSSSMDDSLGGSAGAPEPKNLPDASPHTILQIMTCHPVPGGLLLSPLADNIVALRKKSASVTKEHEAPEFDDDKAELNREWCHTTSAAGDNKNQVANKFKYDEKKDHLPSIKNSQCRHNDSAIVNKGTMPQLLDMSDDAGSVLLPRSTKTEQHSVEESEKLVADLPNHLKETKNGPLKARGRDASYFRGIESTVDVKAVSANDDNHTKCKPNLKASTVRNAFVDLSKDSKTGPTFNQGFLDKIKYDSDGYNDRPSTTSSQPPNVPPNKASLDRNNSNLNRRMMGRFRRLLNDLALKEVYLNGRRYTWSNGQNPPTLVHLDRVFCTADWEESHGDCHLRCLASVISDHSPLLLDCSPLPQMQRRFHFEDFWVRQDGFHDVVAEAWQSVEHADPFRRLMLRLQATARKLTSWSSKTIGNVRNKLAISRELLLRFDKAQEDRILSDHEEWLRKQIKIAYLGLASLDRTIARQRSRIASLKDGDANTTFFHRQCSFRRQKKHIHSLMVDGRAITDQGEMAEAAFWHFDGLLGTDAPRDCTLNLEHLIEPAADLTGLEAPFGADEIWHAIKRLPARKAPGPDGFTAEFLRACWSIVKQDFVDVFQQLYELRGRGFSCLNQALLTLLPKNAEATTLREYRPISLIHLVAKIFAKVLSLRLAPELNSLVSPIQNAFIPKRSLHDNFVLVRQSARVLHQLGAPRVLLKLDLARAFDSLSWPFLIDALRQYGFGDRFIDWIVILLTTASTRVLINGAPGPPVWHRRGLRQGDPLSPQLFVLAVDTLGRLFRRAAELAVLRQLHPTRSIPNISLYADDVVFFCHPVPEDIEAAKQILELFGRASGLQVNFQKSAATLIQCDPELTAPVVQQLGCPIVDMPLTYLGIPLTIKRPTTAQLQPLVEKMAGKLPTWKTGLMDKAGRLALVKAVLAAIPLHQLLALAPTKKIIKTLEKIERGFLWAGRAEANGGHCHVNWRRASRPLQLGGLGIPDLERTGLALRLRWQWLDRTDNNRAWSGLGLQPTAEERSLFFSSTTMTVGDGQTARFWEDRWISGRSISEIAPALYACIPKRRRKQRTVAEGLAGHRWAQDIHGIIGIHEVGQYLHIWHLLEGMVLSAEPDKLIWKWTADGNYSAKSAYLTSFQGSIASSTWKLIWKTWAPPRVKFFHWLACLDRCWTADRLARHGLQHHPRCPLCDQEPETMSHLTLHCPFSRQVWHEILSWLRIPCTPPANEASLLDWWTSARQSTPKPMHKGLASATLLTPWMIWKHRNDCIFNNARPSVSALVSKIKDEAMLWAKAGALGLGVVLPTTWDVH